MECTCLRCGRVWTPRKKDALPVRCPSCQNPNWNKPVRRKKAKGETTIPDVLSRRQIVPLETSECAHAPERVAGVYVLEGSGPAYGQGESKDGDHDVPPEKDSLSAAKARAEELMRQLTA